MDRTERSAQVVLYIAALLCGIAVVGVVGPHSWLEGWVRAQYRPMAGLDGFEDLKLWPVLQYGLRVACAVSAFAGLFFLVVARRPSEHAQLVNLAGTGFIFVGVVALMAGASLGLEFWGYFTHVALSVAMGLLLFAFSPRRRRGKSKRQRSSSRRSGATGRRKKRRRVWRESPPDTGLPPRDPD